MKLIGGRPESCVIERRGIVDLGAQGGIGQACQDRVRHRVVADRITGGYDLRPEARIGAHGVAEGKERGSDAR